MNILFVGVRGIEEEITSAPKKISNALYNHIYKNHNNVYFFGVPLENDNLPVDDDHVMIAELNKLGEFIKDKKIDTVYFSRYYSKIALYLIVLKKIYRFKLVYTVHGIIKKEKRINHTFKFYSEIIENMLLKSCDSIVAVSEGLKKELLNFYPTLNEKKITVIFNGVSICPLKETMDIRKLFRIPEDKKVLFTTGTRKIKNNEILIQSILNNHKLNKSVFLIIAGAADTDYAKNIIEKYKHNENIKFTGQISVDFVNNIYSAMDLYIQISSFETFGMAIVEAMLHKKNVLLSSKLPIAQYFSEEQVCLFNPEENLADAILNCLGKNTPVNEAGYEKAQELFNWDNISEKYYKTFTSVL